MKALMTILSSDAPVLNKYENWSNEFRFFIYDCLQKDPARRISADEILSKHKKFFMKAADSAYIEEHLLFKLEPLLDRVPPKVRAFGQNYFDNQYQKQAQQLGLYKKIT